MIDGSSPGVPAGSTGGQAREPNQLGFSVRNKLGGSASAVTLQSTFPSVAVQLLHTIALDGVFAPNSAGELVFHELPCLETSDVADLMQVIRVRILSYLVRAQVIENACELTVLEDTLAEREPALAQLAAAFDTQTARWARCPAARTCVCYPA